MLPYDETGSGPALILLHAGIADRSMWADQLAPLADAGYRVVAPELPGFGEVPMVDGGAAPWLAVLETMDGLGVERAALVGNSFGGAVAMRVAVTAPERVWALALFDAPPADLEPSPELAAAWEAEENALERGDVEAAVAAVVDTWTLPDAPAELRERVGAMQRRTFGFQLGGDEPEEAPDPLEENPDALAALDIPALVAAGEHDKQEFLEGATRLAKALKTDRTVMENAGHLPPLETPEAFRALLLRFLATSNQQLETK
jgi:3-oxoadipate enol-lactonase